MQPSQMASLRLGNYVYRRREAERARRVLFRSRATATGPEARVACGMTVRSARTHINIALLMDPLPCSIAVGFVPNVESLQRSLESLA